MALALLLTIGLSSLSAASTTSKVWTDPTDGSLPNDFKFQGEYAATGVGVQVIALGKGSRREGQNQRQERADQAEGAKHQKILSATHFPATDRQPPSSVARA